MRIRKAFFLIFNNYVHFYFSQTHAESNKFKHRTFNSLHYNVHAQLLLFNSRALVVIIMCNLLLCQIGIKQMKSLGVTQYNQRVVKDGNYTDNIFSCMHCDICSTGNMCEYSYQAAISSYILDICIHMYLAASSNLGCSFGVSSS